MRFIKEKERWIVKLDDDEKFIKMKVGIDGTIKFPAKYTGKEVGVIYLIDTEAPKTKEDETDERTE